MKEITGNARLWAAIAAVRIDRNPATMSELYDARNQRRNLRERAAHFNAILSRELTYTMRCFLDNYRGADLIEAAYDFRNYFGLTQRKASEIIAVWKAS